MDIERRKANQTTKRKQRQDEGKFLLIECLSSAKRKIAGHYGDPLYATPPAMNGPSLTVASVYFLPSAVIVRMVMSADWHSSVISMMQLTEDSARELYETTHCPDCGEPLEEVNA